MNNTPISNTISGGKPKITLTQDEFEILMSLKVLGMRYISKDFGDHLIAYRSTYSCELASAGRLSYQGNNLVILDVDGFDFVGGEKQTYEIEKLLKGE